MMVMDSILETLFKVKKKASVNLTQHLLCFWAAEGKRTSSLNEVDGTLSMVILALRVQIKPHFSYKFSLFINTQAPSVLRTEGGRAFNLGTLPKREGSRAVSSVPTSPGYFLQPCPPSPSVMQMACQGTLHPTEHSFSS